LPLSPEGTDITERLTLVLTFTMFNRRHGFYRADIIVLVAHRRNADASCCGRRTLNELRNSISIGINLFADLVAFGFKRPSTRLAAKERARPRPLETSLTPAVGPVKNDLAAAIQQNRHADVYFGYQKQTFDPRSAMSALPPADIGTQSRNVRYVPILLQKSVAGFFGR
jgi:hypothetical protein